ncbi:hypothetical protein P152DRAFT_304103 [Eremomyces bilateralis CBS 781.70]|uniref:Uncharacterized protein n=1 Tax=Eremomyces bilateralis CBS 781.70 TaxID=1392243 RepID=A0A6G1G820_9PEZI|nr:uncharacterized protein P152DRAFT_304103 [Eremomyces bilateralis CBS 781.70]KAF1814086.1 hypothetical protein P152DRAFT_304103 [Eremomyces bilateralis CBS 781.70]
MDSKSFRKLRHYPASRMVSKTLSIKIQGVSPVMLFCPRFSSSHTYLWSTSTFRSTLHFALDFIWSLVHCSLFTVYLGPPPGLRLYFNVTNSPISHFPSSTMAQVSQHMKNAIEYAERFRAMCPMDDKFPPKIKAR